METKRATEGRFSSLLADPPLIDRITWREGVSPRTLISQDTGLKARTFGSLFLAAAVVGFVSLVLVADPGNRHDAVLAAISVVALLMSAFLFVVYRKTPDWVFQAATALGSLMIAAATAGGSTGAEGSYAVFYVWVVLLAFLFFPFPAAIAQTLFAAGAYSVVLIARGTEFAFNDILGVVVVSATAGAVIGLLRYRLERLAVSLATQANTDPVTTIANRRSFESHFDEELSSAEREGRSLSIVICDLDRFKAVNDRLGHDQGDVALRLAAETIASSVRSVDIVFRLGGEEFAVLLPDTASLEAYAVAERIRGAIEKVFANYPVPVTVSCGLATRVHASMDRKTLLRAADLALYHAKRNGRNRTVSHDPSIDRQSSPASSVK